MKPSKNLRRLAAVFATSCALAAPSCAPRVLAQASATAHTSLELRDNFEAPSADWKRSGDATFSRDDLETRSGKSALHIKVSAQQTPSFQQWNRRLEGARAGDEYQVSVWVRARAVSGTGAYAALEFLNAAGERIGIAQSKVDETSGANDWRELLLEGVAPEKTVALRADLILHARADAYWTFIDFPDDWSATGVNKWGLSKWRKTPRGDDFSTRAPYYAYGLLSKFFGAPAQTIQTSVSDPYLRAASVRHANGKWSVAVVNRYPKAVPLRIKLPNARGNFRVYVYDTAHIPQNRFGDLPAPSRVLAPQSGALSDRIPANSLLVFTNDFEAIPPAAPRNLKIENASPLKLSWTKNTERDVVYYRVYRGATPHFALTPNAQIASTLATTFADDGTINGGDENISGNYFAVVAVDSSGNASRASYGKAQ